MGQVVPQTHRILMYVVGSLGLDSILLTAVSILRDLGVRLLIIWWGMLLMLLKGEGVICNSYMFRGSRDSVVGVKTMLRAGRSGVRIECFPKRPDRLWGPASLLFNGFRGSFPG